MKKPTTKYWILTFILAFVSIIVPWILPLGSNPNYYVIPLSFWIMAGAIFISSAVSSFLLWKNWGRIPFVYTGALFLVFVSGSLFPGLSETGITGFLMIFFLGIFITLFGSGTGRFIKRFFMKGETHYRHF